MKPHIIPRIILKQFSIGHDDTSPVLVMNKSTKTFRERGVSHNTFLGPVDYLGNGEQGTLENEMACKDEPSIRTIIELVRNGSDITEYLPDIKFLLGNNAARNPHFREQTSLRTDKELSTEEFHTLAMDIFPNKYLGFPVCIKYIKSSIISFLLPDFSLNYMILSPEIVIMRIKEEDRATYNKMNELHFVTCLNQISYNKSHTWVVSNTRQLLISLGGTALI